MSKRLTPKQQRFVAEYLSDLNATKAAIRAGYSRKTAETQGWRLLRKAEIQAAVAAGKAKQLASADLTASRVLEELRRLAFVDVRSFFNGNNVKAVSDLTPEQGSVLAGFEVLIKNAAGGDGVTDVVHKFKLWDKPKALEMLAKHFALLTDVVKLEDEAGLIAKLLEGRKRAAAAAGGDK